MRNNTHLIIQGAYGGRDYFYKMAIVNKDVQLMDLQRNHSYQFTIVTAKGPGYDTVEDAKPLNLPTQLWIMRSQLIIETHTKL